MPKRFCVHHVAVNNETVKVIPYDELYGGFCVNYVELKNYLKDSKKLLWEGGSFKQAKKSQV